MSKLSSIPGIGKTSLELLDAAGYSDVEALAKIGAEKLTLELTRANSILKIAKRSPSRANVEKWIASARTAVGYEEEVIPEVAPPVNYETSPEVVSMLASAPFAIPLPARHLMDHQVAVGEIPSAVLLNRYSGDLDVRVEEKFPGMKPVKSSSASHDIRITETVLGRLDIDVSKIKNIDVLAGSAPRRVPASKSTEGDDRVALIRGPLAKTNEGRNPNSRRYIRGVLHSHPFGMRIGAIVTLILIGVLPIAIASAFLLLLSDQLPEHFTWVPKWLLVFPLALPLVGLAYLIWGMNASCRICGQKQFLPKVCLKNAKAHRIRGLGYIIPVCLHMLMFSWFRCTYCGTPVRLKK